MSYPAPGSDQHGHPGAPGYAPAPRIGQMGFTEAVRSVLTQYATFSGRARRSEYWWFYLATVLADAVAMLIDSALGTPVLAILLMVALLIPGVAVTFRRLHDAGRTAWWLLIGFVPIAGAIILLVFFCTDSDMATNKWGPSPKYGA